MWTQVWRKRALTILLLLWSMSGAQSDADFDKLESNDYGGGHSDPEVVSPHSCSIQYYDVCSGWITIWAWGAIQDEAGVVFDLANDCECNDWASHENTGVWWYWRYTMPGYGFTVAYNLFPSDSTHCKIGPSIGTVSGYDPTERWNFIPGLGESPTEIIAITALLEKGPLPWLVTDDNVKNSQAGCGEVPTEARSYYYGGSFTQYCPPQAWHDQLGPVNILMDAAFSCGTTATEESSWGQVKRLFH